MPLRRLSINIHAYSGACECITGVFLFGFQRGAEGRAVIMSALLGFSMLHIVTAMYQSPSVFGIRKIMVPAYFTAVLMKLFAWGMCATYFLGPESSMTEETLHWFLALVLLHHIYVWCRMYMFLLNALNLMRGYEYTLSILFAGLTCVPPALGSAMPLLIFVVVGAFCIATDAVNRSRASDGDEIRERKQIDRALMERECARNPCCNEIYTTSAVSVIKRWDDPTDPSLGCTLDNVGSAVAKVLSNTPITFANVAKHGLTSHLLATRPTECAAAAFALVDFNDSGSLDLDELSELLRNWGLPRAEAEKFLDNAGVGDSIERDEWGTLPKLQVVWRFIFSGLVEFYSLNSHDQARASKTISTRRMSAPEPEVAPVVLAVVATAIPRDLEKHQALAKSSEQPAQAPRRPSLLEHLGTGRVAPSRPSEGSYT